MFSNDSQIQIQSILSLHTRSPAEQIVLLAIIVCLYIWFFNVVSLPQTLACVGIVVFSLVSIFKATWSKIHSNTRIHCVIELEATNINQYPCLFCYNASLPSSRMHIASIFVASVLLHSVIRCGRGSLFFFLNISKFKLYTNNPGYTRWQ